MKPLLLATLVLTLSALVPPEPVQAGQIQRCSAGGTVVYTDKACKSLGGRVLPMSSELIRTLAREAAYADAADVALVPVENAEQIADAQAYLAARRNIGCARTPEQLALQLRGAVSMGDVNRIAASYHWAGMHSDQARSVMARLDALGKEKVTAAHYYNATFGDAAVASMMPAGLRAATGSGAGFLQLVQGNGTSVTEFDVHRVAGCYFVSF